MAAGAKAELMEPALKELDLIDLDDSILNLMPGKVNDFDRANLDCYTPGG